MDENKRGGFESLGFPPVHVNTAFEVTYAALEMLVNRSKTVC